jgi:SAM-dependent methyltransferase
MGLPGPAREIIRRSIPLTCVVYVADNALASLGALRGPTPEHLGGVDVQADLTYARKIACEYIERARGTLKGRVAEVGPGGSAAVALFLLDAGCERVVLIDRFPFRHDPRLMTEVYRRVREGSAELRRRLSPIVDPDHIDGIDWFVGEEAAAENFFRRHTGYDAILSCAVLQHLYDPLDALTAMTGALNPGGLMLHQVDLRDLGMFTNGGHHELTFLTIPKWLYPRMTRGRGRPNRILFHRYRDLLRTLPLEAELMVNHLVGVGPVEAAPLDRLAPSALKQSVKEVQLMRKRLAPEFRGVADEDLAVASFFLRATRT